MGHRYGCRASRVQVSKPGSVSGWRSPSRRNSVSVRACAAAPSWANARYLPRPHQVSHQGERASRLDFHPSTIGALCRVSLLDETATLGIALLSTTLACRLNIYDRRLSRRPAQRRSGAVRNRRRARARPAGPSEPTSGNGASCGAGLHVPKPRRFRVSQRRCGWAGGAGSVSGHLKAALSSNVVHQQ